jgi:mRNA interferase MazF
MSPAAANRVLGLGFFCPITNQIKGYPFEVKLPTGLRVTGAVLIDQMRAFDWQARSVEFVCTMPTETMTEVVSTLRALLPLT